MSKLERKTGTSPERRLEFLSDIENEVNKIIREIHYSGPVEVAFKYNPGNIVSVTIHKERSATTYELNLHSPDRRNRKILNAIRDTMKQDYGV